MATLVLQTIGSVVGNAVGGPIGSALGRAVGGLGGGAIDQALLPDTPTRYAIGPRLKVMDGVTSSEGAGIPRVYGRARLGGQMIWATRFLERASFSVQNTPGQGKNRGSTTVNISYSYSASFAIALCEGPIGFVRRIWADGSELDLTKITLRIYRGTEDQQPDPLIVAKEGADATPAFRGVAYVVFDDLPLSTFGNRIPQFTFEIVRPVSGLGERIRAVDVIPGATEAGYLPALKLNFWSLGATDAENRHQLTAATDWIASIDALQALCPNLESVALVVAWFGDDLRAAHCEIAPGVDSVFKTLGQFNAIFGPYWPPDWSVAGLDRGTARLVSQVDGRSAYGGTPSDASVKEAIIDLRARGLSVVFYPFLMMDVPPGNTLPDPYAGTTGQAVFPWRGRITCDPAPGRPGSPDGSHAAQAQVDAFFIRYRAFILHYANLCRSAGGVDAFLIGSEFIGLTRIRSGPGHYPAVAALTQLAADVKAVLGPETKISYAADWTEYGAHVPTPGELRFPLDPLWASPAVDFVGLDAYWPLSDWRDGDAHLDRQIAGNTYDLAYLQSRLASGEAYDWYYANVEARVAQIRTPITDALGKPWVYRQKDILSWWSNPHVERVDGAELPSATAWTPMSKPIWLVETGCPAVDRGANSPNVFPDARSAEGGLPYFSRGGRDDLIQARFIEATIAYFDPTTPDAATRNPVSPIYGGPMVDPARLHIWCWDSRPFPAFPTQASVWSDGANWQTGHWLNGRLEGVSLDRLLMALADDVAAPIRAGNVNGFVDGYVLDRPMSPREAIDPLAALFGFDAVSGGGSLGFVGRDGVSARDITIDDFVPQKDGALVSFSRAQESDLPAEIALAFSDSENNFEIGRVTSRRLEGQSRRQSEAQAAIMTHRANAESIAESWLQDLWVARETATFTLRPGLIALQPGDIIRLCIGAQWRLYQIRRIADGLAREVVARAIDPTVYDISAPRFSTPIASTPKFVGPPYVVSLDLATTLNENGLCHVAAIADPWPGALAIYRLPGDLGAEPIGIISKKAMIGETLDTLGPGFVGRFNNGPGFRVKFASGALSSAGDLAALAGRSAVAIRGSGDAWEIVAFSRAELEAPGVYRLRRLLRGLGGETYLAQRETPAGATVVLLDDAITPLARGIDEIGAAISYGIGPADYDVGDPRFIRTSITASNKSLRPLAPAHARARRTPAGVEIRFIRRGRIDADAWGVAEIPLGETAESYEAEISTPGAPRIIATKASPILYPAADEIFDFGAIQPTLTVSLFQMSPTVGRGFPLTLTLTVQ